MNQYRIGIDCRFWGIDHAGLGRYTRELVLAIVGQLTQSTSGSQSLTPQSLTLFFQKSASKKDKEYLKNLGCTVKEINIPHYTIREQLFFSRLVDTEHLDLMHYPHFNIPIFATTPYIVTVHDLIKHFFKGQPVTTRNLLIYWAKYGAYRVIVNRAIHKSQAIIVPSYFVKDQIVCQYANIHEPKIHVIYEGVSSHFQQKIKTQPADFKQLSKKYSIRTGQYFIYTGSAYYHKDLPTLLTALKLLNHEAHNYKLIIACARNQFWQTLKTQVHNLNLSDSVILPGAIPDYDLQILYQHATAYVFPSLMEGFGLPGLEAMSSHCPVIASRAGSLPEVYGHAAIYFQPGDPQDLAAKMHQLSQLTAPKRQALIEKSLSHAAEFSWQKAGSETLNIYQAAVQSINSKR